MLNDLFFIMSKNRHRAFQVETPQRTLAAFHGKSNNPWFFESYFRFIGALDGAGQAHFLVWLGTKAAILKKRCGCTGNSEQSRIIVTRLASFTPH